MYPDFDMNDTPMPLFARFMLTTAQLKWDEALLTLNKDDIEKFLQFKYCHVIKSLQKYMQLYAANPGYDISRSTLVKTYQALAEALSAFVVFEETYKELKGLNK